LSEASFASAIARGKAMGLADLIAFARDQKAGSKAKASEAARPPSTALTKRELEIARLIAEGLTAPQVGGKLFISERTVDSHVTNMLNKLGFNSRIQLARWVGTLEEAPTT